MFAASLDAPALAAFDGRALLLVLSLFALGMWGAMARTRPARAPYVWRCKVDDCNVEGDAPTSTAADKDARRHYMLEHYRPAVGCPNCEHGDHARCLGRARGCECACAYRREAVQA